jgi:predicted transcriptional regulator/transcriptional regulator with XRE-family HTH domain
MSGAERKLFLGGRLKRLRRDLGLNQTAMAEDLGLSPSYLNLMERNQRPVTAQVLLRLAEAYDLDLRAFSASADTAGASELGEVLTDELFRDLSIPRHEVSEVGENAPGVAEAFTRLYQAYLDQRRIAALGAADPSDPGPGERTATPSAWVRDFIQDQRNYFPELEEAGEALAGEIGAEPQEFAAAGRKRLEEKGIGVQVGTVDLMSGFVRRYDYHRRRLYLSEILPASGRAFAIAYQLALAEHGELITATADRAAPPDKATRNLLRVSLANYLAGAVLMPYAAFQGAAEASAHDLELICARFAVSFEQACHRLTTLSRQGARGVPFFMLRVDAAGNISKRFAGSAFPFSRFGGTCPRWNIHGAFKSPGRIITQIVETPDGARYFTFARTVHRIAASGALDDADLAIGMGCELKYASKLAYARGLDLANPAAVAIGPACRICERPNCPQRAAEPVTRTLTIYDYQKSISPYPFTSAV